MSFDIYFLKPIFKDEEEIFKFVQSHFSSYTDYKFDFEMVSDPFPKRNRFKIIVNSGSYHMSCFCGSIETAQSNLDEILGESVPCYGDLRLMFAPDPELEYDFVLELLLHFEHLIDVVVYALRLEEIFYAPPQFAHLVK